MITNPILQTAKKDNLSKSYNFISTVDIIDLLEKNNFELKRKEIQKVVNPDFLGFQKHLLVFKMKQVNHSLKHINDEIEPQLLVTNGHDGKTAFKLMLGFYRFICSNGLGVGSNLIEPVYIRHNEKGATMEKIVEGTHEIINHSNKVVCSIEHMSCRILSDCKKDRFNDEAKKIVFKNDNGANLLQCRRKEDNKNDLWTTFNVIQENAMKGNLKAKRSDGKNMTTRKINTITRTIDVNMKLFDLALNYLN